MVRVLLDTCVLSEMQRHGGDPSVQAAVRAYSSSDVYFSVITIGEISKGLSLLPSGHRRTTNPDAGRAAGPLQARSITHASATETNDRSVFPVIPSGRPILADPA